MKKQKKDFAHAAKKKLNVAVFFGGCSPEYSVSLKSASAVLENLSHKTYHLLMIGITKEGEWYHYTGTTDRIRNDTWHKGPDCAPAVLSPSRKRHCLIVFQKDGIKYLPIDIAFPILHGKNGEDGTLQGAIEMAGIPLAGCGVLASALSMDKDRAHKLASLSGVRIPKSIVLEINTSRKTAVDFSHTAGFPLYVKPVKAGSSYGVTKVTDISGLIPAIELAFTYDNQVIIEENIDGFEVGCAILGNVQDERLLIGEVDEIELSSGFFDFTEKYTLQTSKIHVPARISPEKASEIKAVAEKIYRILGLSGFARIDLFLTPHGDIIFNEVNTIPGFTEHSRYPGMMKAAGYSFCDILSHIIETAVRP